MKKINNALKPIINPIKKIIKSSSFKKYGYLLLLVIPLIFSIYLRLMPAYLPITDQWAEDTIYANIDASITPQVKQMYPNLPNDEIKNLVKQEREKFIEAQGKSLQIQIDKTSEAFKQEMKDENGITYLLAIDPYYYLRHSQHYIDNGQAGTEWIDSETISESRFLASPVDYSSKTDWDGQQMAPNGKPTSMSFHAYFQAYLFKFIRIFNSNISLMAVAFYIPVLIAALSIIPAFFLGKRFGGNIGGFFSAMFLAVSNYYLSRTAGGFADTDAYNMLFPLFILWTFILAYDAKNIYKRFGYITLSGFLVGLFAFTWGGWWFPFDIILGAAGIFGIYLLISNIAQKANPKKIFNNLKPLITVILGFIILSGIFVTAFTDFKSLTNSITGPFAKKEIKTVGKTTLWPNIKTTVAELNEVSVKKIVTYLGGNLLLAIALLGLILLFISKDKTNIKYGIILALWLFGSFYASTKGIRFILLIIPAFILCFGTALGILFNKISRYITKNYKIENFVTKSILFILLLLILIQPIKAGYNTATREVPNMNDGWYNALNKIKTETSPNSIINSWWDFGHWFITIGNRRVTFDGGGQDKHMAYWIGRSLLTNDEKHAAGILRMVDCGNNNAFRALDGINSPYLNQKGTLNDTVKSIEILNKIVVMSKEDAKTELLNYVSDEKAEEVLKYTHCTPPDNYYITSQDMVGKSGVWGHFGSWDFKKASMYNKVHNKEIKEGMKILKEEFNLSDTKANEIYYEIKTIDANNWISGWPGYMGMPTPCRETKGVAVCNNGLMVNLSNYDAALAAQDNVVLPNSLVYFDNNTFIEKQFDSKTGISAGLIENNGNYMGILMDPLQASSTFTRLFFFEGKGSECFELFDARATFMQERIYTWKVNWDCLE